MRLSALFRNELWPTGEAIKPGHEQVSDTLHSKSACVNRELATLQRVHHIIVPDPRRGQTHASRYVLRPRNEQ